MTRQPTTIDRRRFLIGSTIALMLPALESFAADPAGAAGKGADKGPPRRFLSVYHPDGVGMPLKADPAWTDWSWFPRVEGDTFKLTKVLDVLEPLRGDITIYSGLSHPAARKVHGHSNADQYLTGAPVGGSGAYQNSISVDQVYAAQAGERTRFASLVLSTNGGTGAPRGAQTQSFTREGRPIPALNRPKQVFDQLFVAQDKDARAQLVRSKSALDLLLASARTLQGQVSAYDKQTLTQYLDAVRDTELKLERATRWIDAPVPKVDAASLKLDVDANDARAYLETMYDLIYLAFRSDSTRAATFQLGRENGEGIHDNLAKAVGFQGGAHGLTHDVKKPEGWKHLGTYNRFQAEMFGRFVQKLKDTPEATGHGSMLDHTFAMHGSASSSFHTSRNYPIISAGGKNLGFKNGRFLKFGKGNEDNQADAGADSDATFNNAVKFEEEPLAHLFVTVLQRLGVETTEFAGYKGGLERV
jgi:hypothetical protein